MRNVAICLLSLSPLLAAAQVNPSVERYTYSYIDPGAPGTFAGASLVYNNSFLLDGNFVGDAFYAVGAPPLATGITFYGSGGATVDPGNAPDGAAITNVKVSAFGSEGQGWGFDFNVLSSPVPGQGPLRNDVVDGHHVLRFNGGGSGLLAAGGRFYSSVIIQGDWSSPLSHSPVQYGAGYSLIENFDYATGATRFSIDTNAYNGTDPSISFYLIGAPVPEPGTWALCLLGLAGLGAVRRERPTR